MLWISAAGARQQLNSRIIARGKRAAEHCGARLRELNCCSDSINFPAAAPNQGILMQSGPPDKVIPKPAREQDAAAILTGMTRRNGLKRARRGNTIEKIIGAVPQDLIMLA